MNSQQAVRVRDGLNPVPHFLLGSVKSLRNGRVFMEDRSFCNTSTIALQIGLKRSEVFGG